MTLDLPISKFQNFKMSARECISVENLRKKYNDKEITLEKWLKNENNIYIGRNMAFYVKGAVKSKWANNFKVKKFGRDECLKLYKGFIILKIKEDPVNFDISSLKGKVLGCFCKENERCHADILIELCNESN